MVDYAHFRNCLRDPCSCEIRRYWLIFLVALLIFGIELVGGLWSGSLALLSDAGHVFADKIAIISSIVIESAIYRDQQRKTRWRHVGAYINAALLLAVAIWLGFEAVARFQKPQEILGAVVIPVAVVGMALNYLQYRILKPVANTHLTSKGMHLHILSDIWQSSGVIVAGILMLCTGSAIFDLIVSAVIAIGMTVGALRLITVTEKHEN